MAHSNHNICSKVVYLHDYIEDNVVGEVCEQNADQGSGDFERFTYAGAFDDCSNKNTPGKGGKQK